MLKLNEKARQKLDGYLQQVRIYLKGSKTVDPDEVESNIMEHIETELGGASTVSCEQLDAVLSRLGSPRQWVPADELSPWRLMIARLRTGPEDWRLAYIAFGLLVLGIVLPWTFVILAIAAFVFARAALAESTSGKDLGAQRWLIYPPLLAVYVPLALVMLLWPTMLVVTVGEEIVREYRQSNTPFADDTHCWVIAWCICLGAQGLWLAVFGVILSKLRSVAAVAFRPFVKGIGSKVVLGMVVGGLLLAVVCFVAGNLYVRYLAG